MHALLDCGMRLHAASCVRSLVLAGSWDASLSLRRVLSRLSRRRPRYFRRDRTESVIPQTPNQIMDPREWMRRDNYQQIVQARQRLQNLARRDIQPVHEGDEIPSVASFVSLFNDFRILASLERCRAAYTRFRNTSSVAQCNRELTAQLKSSFLQLWPSRYRCFLFFRDIDRGNFQITKEL